MPEALDAPRLPPGLLARRIAASDAADWLAYAHREEVKRHTSSTIETLDDVAATIERCLSDDPAAPVTFAVREAATDRFVGTVGFHSVSPVNRSAEITYGVDPAFWGRGIASAACAAAAAWGFGARGYVRIQGTTLESNVASRRILEKCGFAFEGKLRNFRIVRGRPHDFLLYAIRPGDASRDASRPLTAGQPDPAAWSEPNASRAAATVASISAAPCAALTKPAS